MALLTPLEKVKCEKLFAMEEGFVCDFSNATFGTFVSESIGIDVYDKFSTYANYSSKAKKMRHLWTIEDSGKIGKLLLDMCDYTEASFVKQNSLTPTNTTLLEEVRQIGMRLRGDHIDVVIPKVQEETLASLISDIKSSLERNAPEFALDRLHTFASKMLRQTCSERGIVITTPQGEYLPLHSMVGMLAKKYEQDPTIKSEFSVIAIKTSISLFEKYNDIRNKGSYAHDNDILEKLEAEYAVRIMAATLSFIDNTEKKLGRIAIQNKAEKGQNDIVLSSNLPF